MTIDPRTPVIVGVGQRSQRVDRGEPELEPVDLMVVAAQQALENTGTTVSPDEIDSVRTVALLSWRYTNPGRLVGERLGITGDFDSAVTPMGGNSPQSLVNEAALDIAAGRADCVLLAGAETWRTRSKYRAQDEKPPWTTEPADTEPARLLGEEKLLFHEAELALGIAAPIQIYPMFENAYRHRLGRSREEHLRVISEMWARFSEVAAKNPHAWIQESMTAEQIRTPSPENRIISLPYTKVMNSNNAVEQSASVLLCSAEVAERLGVPRDRWVFPVAGSDTHEHLYLSERWDLSRAPAVKIAADAALDAAGCTIEDIDHVDLYSCFPVAPEIGAEALGLDVEGEITLTGGLPFAGGPWNNYVMHSIATMVETLRAEGGKGLVWANGGNLTKHAFGIYSTDAPAGGFQYRHPQDEVDALPKREVSKDYEGPATVETYTVMFDKEGEPELGIASLLTDDGRRAWSTTTDASVLATMVAEDVIGRAATRSADGTLGL